MAGTGLGRGGKKLAYKVTPEAVAKFEALWGEAKLWAAKGQRAVSLSGVPADQVEDLVTEHYNITTPLFIKAGLCMRPMAQPPFQISGESAAAGGLHAQALGAPSPPLVPLLASSLFA